MTDNEHPQKHKREPIDWSTVKTKGDEAQLFADYLSRLMEAPDWKFYGLLLGRLNIAPRLGLRTFAVSIDFNQTTGVLRSHRRFLYWCPTAVRVIRDVREPPGQCTPGQDYYRDTRKMAQILPHGAHHILLMHFSRLFDFLSICQDDEERRIARQFFNTAADFEINHRLLKHGYWDEVEAAAWDPMPGLYAWQYDMPTDLTMEDGFRDMW